MTIFLSTFLKLKFWKSLFFGFYKIKQNQLILYDFCSFRDKISVFFNKNCFQNYFSAKSWFWHVPRNKILSPKLKLLCNEWQLVCHRLVDLKFVTHSQTSPSERLHSPDMISRKNDIKIHHNDPQNVKTKSSPKISFKFPKFRRELIIKNLSFKFLKNRYELFNLNTYFFKYQQ